MNSVKHLLVVDDDPIIGSMLSDYLAAAGFDVQIVCSGAACIQHMAQHPIDLVLLDIGLPDINGIDLGKTLYNRFNRPIIYVTNSRSDVDRILSLEFGGDDYVTKPVDLRELLARIRAVLRRSSQAVVTQGSKIIRFGSWQIDLIRRELIDDRNRRVPLTRGEFDLLAALAEAEGRPMSREFLTEVISNRNDLMNDRSVDALVARLRRKVGRNASADNIVIQTVRGIGYRLISGARVAE